MKDLYNPEKEPDTGYDLYLTAESISLAALVDKLFERIDHPGRETDE